MKTLRRTCAATILSLTLIASASAGDIHSPGIKATETDTTTTTTPSTDTSIIDTIRDIILTVVIVTY